MLVTHAAHFLNRVDEVLVVVDGTISFSGTWNQLLEYKSEDPTSLAAIEYIRSSVQESGTDDTKGKLETKSRANGDKDGSRSTSDNLLKDLNRNDGKLIMVERREHGHSSLKTWLLWFKYAGGTLFLVIQASLMGLDRLAYVGTEVWLSVWTQAADEPVSALGKEFPPQTDGRQAQYQYLAVYATILAVSFTSTILR